LDTKHTSTLGGNGRIDCWAVNLIAEVANPIIEDRMYFRCETDRNRVRMPVSGHPPHTATLVLSHDSELLARNTYRSIR
jgi:hypothetical protein